jgi:hypothetical protein
MRQEASMTTFDARERAFEQVFAHDEEARFRALVLRNNLLGQWAAERIGLSGEKARAYVDEIRTSVVTAVMDEKLVDKIRADFERSGVLASEEIRDKMAELMARAMTRVRSDEWKTNL